ncbi:MAG: FAD:protein FMN transferase [Bryobacteraceae bacterium]|nr:FAD:protein FMN transferase [Bryobacteraceae bacterium]MDW8379198.1 FAD:protein FMN transferase [Bryobacterales bacterium]
MKAVVLLWFLKASTAWLAAGELLRLEQSLDAMGTVYTIVAYGEERGALLGAVDQAFEEVRRLDRMLSNYRPDSELSRVNREAARGPVAVSAELFALLEACQRYSQESDGAFDITVGPLMKIWGFYKGSGRLPHRAEIRGVLGRIGYRRMILDPARRTVRFERDGMSLDPGGIGKGYAVDRVAEILKAAKVHAALISAGSSSIVALGSPPGEKGWKIGIRHPKDIRRTIEEVLLKDTSLSTSGTSEKFFRAEGKLYSHIMDPRTGYPAQGMLSVTVIAPKGIDSEAWTKPVFINGRAWASRHLRKEFRVFLCEDNKGGLEQACAWLQ